MCIFQKIILYFYKIEASGTLFYDIMNFTEKKTYFELYNGL